VTVEERGQFSGLLPAAARIRLGLGLSARYSIFTSGAYRGAGLLACTLEVKILKRRVKAKANG
jgi:hypothetical protein